MILATKHCSETNNGINYRLYHPRMDSTELFNRNSVSNNRKELPATLPESIETFVIGSHNEKGRIVKANLVKFIRPASAFDKRPVEIIVDKKIRPKSALRRICSIDSCDIIKPIFGRAKSRPQSSHSGKTILNGVLNDHAFCKISRPQSGASSTTLAREDMEIVGQKKDYGDPFPSWFANKYDETTATGELEIKFENILLGSSYGSKSEIRIRSKRPTIVGHGYDLIY
jgi:hypothetical protein